MMLNCNFRLDDTCECSGGGDTSIADVQYYLYFDVDTSRWALEEHCDGIYNDVAWSNDAVRG
eukprot:m.249809 g.249809  ORF g.249809 m.249809 type:complete len:62 (-) comp19528_c0_seq7:1268-1453(-)